jgi:hypothetical protein
MKNPRFTRVLPLIFAASALVATTAVRADVEGRWKVDGSGGCYFDANDDGPNQCTPPDTQPGRWKIDGAGGCYFDTTDSGPDQC